MLNVQYRTKTLIESLGSESFKTVYPPRKLTTEDLPCSRAYLYTDEYK